MRTRDISVAVLFIATLFTVVLGVSAPAVAVGSNPSVEIVLNDSDYNSTSEIQPAPELRDPDEVKFEAILTDINESELINTQVSEFDVAKYDWESGYYQDGQKNVERDYGTNVSQTTVFFDDDSRHYLTVEVSYEDENNTVRTVSDTLTVEFDEDENTVTTGSGRIGENYNIITSLIAGTVSAIVSTIISGTVALGTLLVTVVSPLILLVSLVALVASRILSRRR
jgi:hypothetical protein